jgi:hypothetical protein
MWQGRFPSRPSADALVLQSTAKLAGLALACPFSSSAEFEAAILAAKLRAGGFGPKRHWRYMACVCATAGMAAMAFYLM